MKRKLGSSAAEPDSGCFGLSSDSQLSDEEVEDEKKKKARFLDLETVANKRKALNNNWTRVSVPQHFLCSDSRRFYPVIPKLEDQLSGLPFVSSLTDLFRDISRYPAPDLDAVKNRIKYVAAGHLHLKSTGAIKRYPITRLVRLGGQGHFCVGGRIITDCEGSGCHKLAWVRVKVIVRCSRIIQLLWRTDGATSRFNRALRAGDGLMQKKLNFHQYVVACGAMCAHDVTFKLVKGVIRKMMTITVNDRRCAEDEFNEQIRVATDNDALHTKGVVRQLAFLQEKMDAMAKIIKSLADGDVEDDVKLVRYRFYPLV